MIPLKSVEMASRLICEPASSIAAASFRFHPESDEIGVTPRNGQNRMLSQAADIEPEYKNRFAASPVE